MYAYKTYPMIRAAAVRIHAPSPRGFGGTGETGKVTFGLGGEDFGNAALVDAVVGEGGREPLAMVRAQWVFKFELELTPRG